MGKKPLHGVVCGLVHIVEPRVVHAAPGRNPRLGVIVHGLLQQVQAHLVQGRRHGAQRKARPLRESRVPVLKRGAARPLFLVRSPEEPENFVHFVDFAVAREQRALCDHFYQNGADGPGVYGGRVRGGAQQNLRRAVPQRHHFVSERANGRAERAGQAEVRQLEAAVTSHEQVLRLHVAVHDAAAVAKRKAFHELVGEGLDDFHGQRARLFVNVLLEIAVQELKNQVQAALLLYHVAQPDNIRVRKLFQQRDFAQSSGRHAFVFDLKADFLGANKRNKKIQQT